MNHKATYNKPKLDYHDVKHATFDYDGQSYPVATAPASVFKAAVLEKMPQWQFHAAYKTLMRKRELDLVDRWYLLNCLADKKKGIELRIEQVAG